MFCGHKNLIRLFFAKDYISGDEFGVYKCAECGIVLTRPVPSKKDFKKYYGELYYGKRKSFTEKLINYLRLRRVLKLFPGNSTISLLDVGCGNASFISLLAKRGFKVSGTEIALDSHFADDSRICRKDLEDCEFSDKSFDVITMWHALEHFIEPEKYLAEAKRILKDGGFLIIEIPNFYSWQSKLTKHDWFHLDVPRHLVHYESKTLVNFLEKSGFSVFKISHFSFAYSIFGFIQSVINIFIKRKNLLFDILNGKACLNFAVWRDLIITFLLIIPVSILAIPTAILESIFKKGGIITVFAEKKL